MKCSLSSFKVRVARRSRGADGFSLVELMIVMTLLTLIVLALMQVFSSTQRAFRAGVTQTDALEGGRAVMELIASDLRLAAPSMGGYYYGAVNFQVTNNTSYFQPLVQKLPGGSVLRSNLLQQVFILNHENTKWWGVGYAISTNSQTGFYSLYRFEYPQGGTKDPLTIYTNQWFKTFFQKPEAYGSHLLDGVVHFVVRAHDTTGKWIPNGYALGQTNVLTQTWFYYLENGEGGFMMYSNALPASVELELGKLEDRAIKRAESLPTTSAQANYLFDQSGSLHVFRQIIPIPNVDRAAYQ